MDMLQHIIEKATKHFGNIPGVKAIVLGGSHATGSAAEGSDIDICLYYDGTTGLDAVKVNQAAKAFDDRHQDGLVPEVGGWGPWINGGGWLTSDQVPVDILFRNFNQTAAVVEDCLQGKITLDYQSGHPFAFVNSIYLGEVAYCKPLLEHDEALRNLKQRLCPYPEVYRKAVFEKFLWEAEFSLLCGQKGIKKVDVAYCAGSLFRTVNSLVQVLYAERGEYLLNEKGSLIRLHELADQRQQTLISGLEELLCDLDPGNLSERFDSAWKLLDMVRQETAAR